MSALVWSGFSTSLTGTYGGNFGGTLPKRTHCQRTWLRWFNVERQRGPLRRSEVGDEVSIQAKGRTHTVLPKLDSEGKVRVLQFLYETGLIIKGRPVVDLLGADLRAANLRGVNLRGQT